MDLVGLGLLAQPEDVEILVAERLRQALQDMPELAELSKNILIDVTPEGLRIQLVDQEGRSMFANGRSEPNDRAKLLLRAVARVVNQLPNRISVSGHTSMSPNGVKADGDWQLSAGRAEATRQAMIRSGIPEDRFFRIEGVADRELLMQVRYLLAYVAWLRGELPRARAALTQAIALAYPSFQSTKALLNRWRA